jgi:hypothetical protein
MRDYGFKRMLKGRKHTEFVARNSKFNPFREDFKGAR